LHKTKEANLNGNYDVRLPQQKCAGSPSLCAMALSPDLQGSRAGGWHSTWTEQPARGIRSHNRADGAFVAITKRDDQEGVDARAFADIEAICESETGRLKEGAGMSRKTMVSGGHHPGRSRERKELGYAN
jgi:hypothetical protein